jgi:hypothetical protein
LAIREKYRLEKVAVFQQSINVGVNMHNISYVKLSVEDRNRRMMDLKAFMRN